MATLNPNCGRFGLLGSGLIFLAPFSWRKIDKALFQGEEEQWRREKAHRIPRETAMWLGLCARA